jgi:hypothetical protein
MHPCEGSAALTFDAGTATSTIEFNHHPGMVLPLPARRDPQRRTATCARPEGGHLDPTGIRRDRLISRINEGE